MFNTGGIWLVVREGLFTMSGSNPQVVVSMLGSAWDPSPETPSLYSLAVPNPRCTSRIEVGDSTQLYCKLPVTS